MSFESAYSSAWQLIELQIEKEKNDRVFTIKMAMRAKSTNKGSYQKKAPEVFKII